MKTFGGGLSKSKNVISSDVTNRMTVNTGTKGYLDKTETTEYDQDASMSFLYKDSKYFTPIRSSVPDFAIHHSDEYTDSTGRTENSAKQTNKVLSEDPYRMGETEMAEANLYNAPKSVAQSTYESHMKTKNDDVLKLSEIQAVISSLFNPYYGLDPKGVGPGQWPVAQKDWEQADTISGFKYNYLGDCRISTLVNLSKYTRSLLGQARYKYSDFMFCKELGMPNNHLITLRRYASPIGDQIHGQGAVANNYYITTLYNVQEKTDKELSNDEKEEKKKDPNKKFYKDNKNATKTKKTKNFPNSAKVSDVGHMCCYFGGEDNKLEDIIKYSFKQTYKQMNSEIQRQNSKEDDRVSPLGALINTMNPSYRSHMASSTAGSNNLLSFWGSKSNNGFVKSIFGSQSWHHNDEAMYHVDKNKIYEPKNTIQEIDYYEGKIQFNHEFSLVFSYEMRAYDNISPKAAMLDLVSNVLRTCGTHGSFWGGARQLNGPSPNAAGWNKANHLIDNTWDALGSGLGTMFHGGFSPDSIMAGFSKMLSSEVGQMLQKLVQKAGEIAKEGIDRAQAMADGTASAGDFFGWMFDGLKELDKKTGLSDMVKAKIKDALGRPQMYAWDSLLSGGDTGMWHVTIGNPLRPIMTFGNLEITNTTVEHSGPLGIDDFPTKLKVTVQLKHARPRDIGAIEKMYAFGAHSIYKGKSKTNPQKVYKIFDKDPNSKKSMTDTMSADGGSWITKNDLNPYNDIKMDTTTVTTTEAPTKDENGKEVKGKTIKTTETTSKSTITNHTEQEEEQEYTAFPYNFDVSGHEFGDFMPGLEYVGEFDWSRMRANMDELYQ